MQSCNRGFSLIEVLVSISVLISIVGVYAASSNIVALSRTSKQSDIALRIANSKLEELRAMSYASLPASNTFTDTLLSTLASSSASYTVSTYNAKTKQITVVVGWQEAGEIARSVTLSTLKTEVGGL